MKSLTLQNISKKFGPNLIIDQLSMTIDAGSITALTGESGSGKTTILRLIAGLEKLDEGEITLADKSIQDLSSGQRKIGFVFQDLALFPHLTVIENIVFAVKGKSKKESKSRELLSLIGLEKLGKRYPHQLSGGQQQRVALARALANDPQILLMDEPFSSLDERIKIKVRAEIFEIIKSLKITTIMVTHHPADAFAIADKIAILEQGKVLQYDTPSQIYEQPKNEYVSELFGSGICIKANQQNDVVTTSFGSFKMDRKLPIINKIYLRPETVEATQNEFAHLHGIITHKAFNGPHDLLIISNSSGSEQFEYETERTLLQVGDEIHLKLDFNKILSF